MELVEQEDEGGDGIACVAMATAKEYWQIKEMVFPPNRRRDLALDGDQIIALLDQLEVPHAKEFQPAKLWAHVKAPAIVACAQSRQGGFVWVVYADGEVFDPSFAKPRPADRTRRTPISYLTFGA